MTNQTTMAEVAPARRAAAGAWRRALGGRRELARRRHVVIAVADGTYGLVRGRDVGRLVSLLPARGDARGVAAVWLMRRQARRSTLLLAPDRETAVDYALAWRLDPERIRIVADTAHISATDLGGALSGPFDAGTTWHRQ